MYENQQFKTSDAIIMILLLLFAAMIVSHLIRSTTQDSSVKTAHLMTEKIASQILSGRLEGFQSDAAMTSNRKIASVGNEKIGPLELLGPSGEISVDPWGQPLAYRIWQDGKGKVIAIVWSRGPDQRSDTSEASLSLQERKLSMDKVQFGGDDIGTILASE